ncbi:ribonuclease H [Acidovorax phage ACP17]|uniref:Ribonuclease H n=1 Tax=Acidovorax phage ACP17 TaxID=2010329 RepID=A0A218M2Y6_9CAUD|nr:ribonuclease H [Acidovorax phage ACP17]ASD50418.1 ribonuclease H [Acidovorax phage ACP17]
MKTNRKGWKILLFDANNLFFKTVLEFHNRTGEQVSMDTTRRLLVSSLAGEYRKFKSARAVGGAVLAFDDKNYWRREYFQHYKAARAKGRADSTFDWNNFFSHYNRFKEELAENFPLQSLQVHGAEADDIIAVLALRYAPQGEVVIWSSDTDDLQLQNIDPSIKQYSYVKKKMITPKSEGYTLFEHVVRGDAGDGIPNILSASDHFVQAAANPEKKMRQKSVMTASIQDWEAHGLKNPEKFCTSEEMLRRFKENRTLVDYRYIPADLASRIVDAHEETKIAKGKVFNYLVENRLTNVLAEGAF